VVLRAALVGVVLSMMSAKADGQAQTVYGIGIGKPWRVQGTADGPFVSGGSCFHWHAPAHAGRHHPHRGTTAADLHAADLFAIRGEPLSATSVGASQGPVIAFVNGEQWAGDQARSHWWHTS
jgi:hypothetical protein